MVVRLPPLTVRRSPFAVRRSSCAVRRYQPTARYPPCPSPVAFACRSLLPAHYPLPLRPFIPSHLLSPFDRVQSPASSPRPAARRSANAARLPGRGGPARQSPVPDMMRTGRAHSAHSRIRARRAPSECRAITRANMEEFAMRCSPTAPARNRSCQARTRDVRPGRRLRVPRDRPMHVYAHVDTQSRRKLTRKEAQCMNRSHSMPAWPGGGPRRQHARPARQAPRRRHAAATQRARLRRRQAACRRQRAMTSPACASPTARRPPPNPTRTPARPSAPRRECALARTNRSVLHRCAPRFANAAATRAAPGRARVNRRAWDALAPRSRRRLRHRHCRRPHPAARARRSSRAASAPAARAPDRRAQAA
ncbi:hydrolase, NUDIX family domain protein [Burkholderia pseudomallei MSHR7500]|nr:hydrolase, NUDIX family domain protein [Burkholderia pseudomallei MSHR7500]